LSKRRLSKRKQRALRSELQKAGGRGRGVRRLGGAQRSELAKRVRDDDVTLTDRYRAVRDSEDAEFFAEKAGEKMRRRASKRKDTELRQAIAEKANDLAAGRPMPEHWHRGVVTQLVSKGCIVDSDGASVNCSLRGSLKELQTGAANPVAVGDFVWYEPQPDGTGTVEIVEPRKTKLSRPTPRHRKLETVVVANVELLVIVSSLRRPGLKLGLIDRYLVAAEQRGMDAAVCINKIDLADAGHPVPTLDFYGELGYNVVYTSALRGDGLDEFRALLSSRTSVLAGHSGTGKSSLINAIQPGMNLRVGDVSHSSSKGRHTTSSITLLPLDFGGYVVDTPGIRAFGMWDLHREELEMYFPEIAERTERCRMRNCSHTHEPDCEVKIALEAGEITTQRYESYVNIYNSLSRGATWHNYE